MIDRVYFECDGAPIAPYEDYGIILKSFDAPPPEVKAYRVNLDGANGELDMTEWAGEPKFNDRAVTVALLDFRKGHDELYRKILGRRCKIWKSDEPEYFFDGRCDSIGAETRMRVTNLTCNFVCKPYRLKREQTTITASFTTSSATEIALKTDYMTLCPTIILSNAASLTWGGITNSWGLGTHNRYWPVVTKSGGTLSVQGIHNAGTITIQWRDGVL